MRYDAWIRVRRPSLWRGALAGLAGGLAAAWVMERFQAAVPAATFARLLGEDENGGAGASDEPATVKTAEAISEGVFGHRLTKGEKAVAGPAVHYAFGASMGTLYGTAAEAWPEAAEGLGLPFGAVVWLVADEAAVPALGLADPPTEHPPSTHVYALASHLVFGFTADLVRRAARRLL
jgi:putative membrane protein